MSIVRDLVGCDGEDGHPVEVERVIHRTMGRNPGLHFLEDRSNDLDVGISARGGGGRRSKLSLLKS